MHVIAETRNRIDGFDDVPGEVPRMRGSEPHPTNPCDFPNRSKQFGERLLVERILVRIDVLSQQLDVGITRFGHPSSFGNHRVGSSAPLLAASVGNDAISAEL